MNRANLEKLASYLEALPAAYKHFEMSVFMRSNEETYFFVDKSPLAGSCGTVACAIGHAPAAGIAFATDDEEWPDYSKRVFELEPLEWMWCFDGLWSVVDNTPHGAAKRIRHLLEHGVPENAHGQRWGEEPYLFAQDATA